MAVEFLLENNFPVIRNSNFDDTARVTGGKLAYATQVLSDEESFHHRPSVCESLSLPSYCRCCRTLFYSLSDSRSEIFLSQSIPKILGNF